jgi:predicted nucleic acid-binding Zn finger protein
MATTEIVNGEVAPRDRRAAQERLFVDPQGQGVFHVYSTEGTKYEIFLPAGQCSCDDYHYREPEGGCKHVRRVRMEIGERPVPDVTNPDPILIERGII